MSQPMITIGVLNFNGESRLRKMLPSLLEQDYPNREILVVDNGSTDGSVPYLKRLGVRVVENEENLGAGAGRNVMVENSRGEFILMLDNDMELGSRDFIGRVLKIYRELDKPAFLAPLVIDSGSEFVRSMGLFLNRIQKKRRYSELRDQGVYRVQATPTGASFFRRSIFLDLGGFDQKYSYNMDDYDMGIRANLMGYRNYLTTDLFTIHHGVYSRADVASLCWKNRTYFCGVSRTLWKNYRFGNLLIWAPLSAIWISIKTISGALHAKSVRPIWPFFLSVWTFIRDLPSTLNERRKIQKSRIVKGDNFLKIPLGMKVGLREHGNIKASFDYFMSRDVSRHAAILDVGCNYGSLIAKMHAADYQKLYGIDVNAASIERGRAIHPSLNLASYDGNTLPYPDGHFDIITMFDVIEHIPDVERFLREEVLRVLRPGGRLIFQTPNIITNIPWEIISNRSLTKWREYHCSLQSLHSLKKLLQKSGFSKIRVERHEILTEHNKERVYGKMGTAGIFLLHVASMMPMGIYPNFYGHAEKI